MLVCVLPTVGSRYVSVQLGNFAVLLFTDMIKEANDMPSYVMRYPIHKLDVRHANLWPCSAHKFVIPFFFFRSTQHDLATNILYLYQKPSVYRITLLFGVCLVNLYISLWARDSQVTWTRHRTYYLCSVHPHDLAPQGKVSDTFHYIIIAVQAPVTPREDVQLRAKTTRSPRRNQPTRS